MAQETTKRLHRGLRVPRPWNITRFSLVVSLVFHAFALMVIQKAFPINLTPTPLKTFHVELLRPALNPAEMEKTSQEDGALAAPPESPQDEPSEDTISLDTKDEKYTSYAKLIKKRLMCHWHYPEGAVEDLIEGNVHVLFSLSRDGKLVGLSIVAPSGFEILDSETARCIQASAPFPPFPGSVRVGKLNIRADFAYRLTARD